MAILDHSDNTKQLSLDDLFIDKQTIDKVYNTLTNFSIAKVDEAKMLTFAFAIVVSNYIPLTNSSVSDLILNNKDKINDKVNLICNMSLIDYDKFIEMLKGFLSARLNVYLGNTCLYAISDCSFGDNYLNLKSFISNEDNKFLTDNSLSICLIVSHFYSKVN